MIPFRLIGAHWRKNTTRTVFTVLSVMMAVMLFGILRTFLTALEASVKGSSGTRLIVSNKLSLFGQVKVSMVRKIEAMPGVRCATHWTWFNGVYKDPKNYFARFGVDVPGTRKVYGDKSAEPVCKMSTAEWDAFEKERTACVVGSALVKEFPEITPGATLTITGDIYPTDLRLTVRGVYTSDNPAFDDSMLFFHWAYLDEGIGNRGVCSTIPLEVPDVNQVGEVSKQIDDYFANSSTPTLTQPEQAFNAMFISMMGNIPFLFNSIGSVVLIACFFITLNTMLMGARERIPEVGVLKTLGFTGGAVAILHLFEALLVCLIGGALGTALAWAAARGQGLKLGPMYFPIFLLEDQTKLQALGITVALGLLAGVAPATMAGRLRIVQALRRQ
jgi:putative ABC transport system permease protein